MEGAGSRLGRASSRYGQQPPSTNPANFTGPVRRWEKKWVHVSSLQRSRPSITRHQRSNPSSGPTDLVKSGPGVLLCKWTPLPEPSASAEELLERPRTPPKRKLRYTPIAVLEAKEREDVKMVQYRAKPGKKEATEKGEMSDDDSFDGLLNINQGPMEAGHQVHREGLSTPHYLKTQLNLEIPLESQEDSPDPGWSNQ